MGWKVTAVIVLCLGIYIAYQLVERFEPETVRGKNVLITLASTGIGEQLAYHYARLGANILITARRVERLQQVIEKCKEIGNKNGKYFHISFDMSVDGVAPIALIKYAENVLGSLDYVVLNHAESYLGGHWPGSEERTRKISLSSYNRIASYATRHLEESRGSLIVVSSSSTAGKIPLPFMTAYGAAEHIFQVRKNLKFKALLGGSMLPAPFNILPYTPCSLLFFKARSFLPIFTFFISLCSLLPSNFSSCSPITSLHPCSFSIFLAAPTPFCNFLCSLLPDYNFIPPFLILGHAPWVSRAILPAP